MCHALSDPFFTKRNIAQLSFEYRAGVMKRRLYVKVHGDDGAVPDTLERR